MRSGNRNECIDTIKGFACLAVVFIHYNWGGELSIAVKAISRFAVPYFFFVSGYYLANPAGMISPAGIKRKIRHILELSLKSAVFYWIFCIYWNSMMDSNWNVWTYTKSELNLPSLIKFFLSSDPFVYAHFWYLQALLSCYFVVYLLHRKLSRHTSFILFAALLVVYSLLGEFGKMLGLRNYMPISDDMGVVLSNMFVFRAMPFFLLGIFLRMSDITQAKKMHLRSLLFAVFAGCVLTVAEDRRFGTILMYVGTHVTVIALSLISVWYPDKKIKLMEYIGNRLSMYVYIYHIAVGKVLDLVAAKHHLWGNGFFKMLRPAIVILASLLVSQTIVFVKQKRKRTA